jgi:SAM-dependent methyltransferase
MTPPPRDHDRALADAFDGQAPLFDRSPVHSDAQALERLIAFAGLPEGSTVLDAGCGPGFVAEAFLRAGHRVVGVDLSAEMVERARRRCEPFGDRARFMHGSVFEAELGGPFDAAVSRYVIHHLARPLDFVRRQAALLRPGGILVVCDHTTDPDPVEPYRAAHHQSREMNRDTTHARNLTPGALVDLLVNAGLERVSSAEEAFTLDFDEWYDRGTPDDVPKSEVRRMLLEGPQSRGFTANERPDGGVEIACWRSLVRGLKPERP